jgi:hypothetical protein
MQLAKAALSQDHKLEEFFVCAWLRFMGLLNPHQQ